MAISAAAAAAIAGGIASGAGGLLDTATNFYQNKKNREFSAAEAKKQRDWEERMSSTTYQRAVADMEKAGINPAMAFSNGAPGASTPTGSAAKGNQPLGSNMGGTLANNINSVANLVHAFNFDKNKKNDINPKDTYKLIDSYAKIFGKTEGSYQNWGQV